MFCLEKMQINFVSSEHIYNSQIKILVNMQDVMLISVKF